MSDQLTLDAAGTTFFAGELTKLQATVYGRKFPEYMALTMLPVMVSNEPFVKYVEYETETQVGESAYITDLSLMGPRIDVASERRRSPTFMHGNHYGYTTLEIMAAQRSNRPTGSRLEQRRAMATKRAHDNKTDSLAWFGDNNVGAVGLLNHPDIPRTPASGTFASLISTPDNVLSELNDFINGIVSLTNGVEKPDTLLLPQAQYDLIASTRLSTASDTTVLSYFIQHNPYIKTVAPVPRLDGQGAGGADIAIAYRKSADNLQLHIVAPYTVNPPEKVGMTYKVDTYGVFGAVEVYYPEGVGVLEGI